MFPLPIDVLSLLPQEYVASDGIPKTDSSALGISFAPASDINVNEVLIIGSPFFSIAGTMVEQCENMDYVTSECNHG